MTGTRRRPEPGTLACAREVLGSAYQAARRHTWRIVVVAISVTTITALAQIAVEDLVDRADLTVSIVADLSGSVVSLLGAVFLSGFLSQLVRQPDDAQDSVTVRAVARTLPWAQLIGADLLVTLLVVLGLLALVIPGLAAFVLLAVVGPVIETERLPVRAALRRSARLVRPRFWMAALLVLPPILVSSELDALGPKPDSVAAVLGLLALHGIAAGLVEAAIGLILVRLRDRLADLSESNREPSAGAG